jgi:cyclophilin family peptidyl-prolyl cis-trans isomerase
MKRVFLTASLVIALLATGVAGAQTTSPAVSGVRQGAQTPQAICDAATQDIPTPDSREFDEPEDVLEDDVDYAAVLCTERGPIYFDLFEEAAPQAVNSFVFLAGQDYFNNLTFHRVIPGFMAQTGDPTGTGGGGPGYMFDNETSDDLLFDQAGRLGMANSGPDTNGSQFFITYAPAPWLDGGYTIFGQVVQGLEVNELITPRDPQSAQYTGDVLRTVVIIEDPASVEATPDGPPSVDHLQAMTEQVLAFQLTAGSPMFVIDEDATAARDLDAQAAFWAARDDALGDAMQAYLSDQGFEGAAALALEAAECPDNPEDLPLWRIGLEIADFGAIEAGDTVVFDDARADLLVESAFDAYSDPDALDGRLFTASVEHRCGETGALYRYELPLGRYVLAVELVADSRIINDTSAPTDIEFLVFMMDDLLYGSMAGTLSRGNAALQ